MRSATLTAAVRPPVAGESREEVGRGAKAAKVGAIAAFPLAFLLAATSLGGILLPATYARETANWAAQAVGQDWVDLLIAVPWLAIAAVGTLRGSRRALLLLAGGVLYALYELVIYAFAIHFNALFLIYCAGLGLALLSTVEIAAGLAGDDVARWFSERVPRPAAAALLIGVGVVFAGLWLSEIVPALWRRGVPPTLAETGLYTNPVQVMDLSVVLPAHVAAGVFLLRRRRLGYAVAPILLAFDVLMALSIGGMMVVMHLRGAAASPVVAGAMGVLSLLSASVLLLMLRALRRSDW